jgi:serine/threonine protein kinase/tetratricopeptide (TPR) repeat protein/TolB-like protein
MMQVEGGQQRLEELFHAARGLGAEERGAYLSRACGGDERLRREVESLVAALERRPNFISESPFALVMRVMSGEAVGALVGRSVGHYRVLRLLGSGGMGNVYLAEDSRLKRKVALKFISHALAGDEWGKAQLAKEAQAVVNLEDHQNICAVYAIEEIDGHDFIAMQYVEGQTLDVLIKERPPTPRLALDVSEQVASALSAAHAHGIIHRDVKPQNVMVAASGQVKVLDFGLANLTPPPHAEVNGGATRGQVTQAEPLLGTVAYMSPEQSLGRQLDARSDIFSFGIVLYEMLCGRHPFKREGVEETLAAIRTAAPPAARRLAPGLSGGLYHVACRCMAKRPRERYQTADELLSDLRRLKAGERLRRYALPATALVLLVAATLTFVYLRYTLTHTLAVMPVVNASDDPDADFLGAGLTNDLASKLSRLARLRVRVPSKGNTEQGGDPVGFGRVLQAEAVLVSRVARGEGGLVLRTRLVKVSDGGVLWEEENPLDVLGFRETQNRIALKTTSGLNMWLRQDEERLLTRHETDNPEALRLYLLGKYYWARRDQTNIKTAIRLFEQATELDPLYAQAHAALADSYMFLPTVAFGPERTADVIEKARASAKKAVELSPLLCEAHTSLGVILLKYDWDWKGAEKEFRRAIELNPDYNPAHFNYSTLLMVTGRFEEAIRESERNKALDPFSAPAILNVGRAHYFARRYDVAAQYCNEVLDKQPQNESALYILGASYIQRGQYNKGIETLERLYAVNPLYAAAPLGFAYGKASRRADARRILDMLPELSKGRPVPAQEKAIISIGLNDRERAFQYLEEAYRERFASLISLTVEPLFDDIRADPRYEDLARRMNLRP